MKFYEMSIAGYRRSLPVCPINDKISIAAFIMYGDVEVTKASAKQLIKRSPGFDVIITPEAKSIPLAYEMARQSGKPYVVAHKGTKLYMTDPIKVDVRSITTDRQQSLYISSEEVALLKGKKVLIVDDVISTGESLKAVETLVEMAQGSIVGKSAVLAEGDAADRKDIIYLEQLPLIINE